MKMRLLLLAAAFQAGPFQFELSRPHSAGHFLRPQINPTGVSEVFSRGECQGDVVSRIFQQPFSFADKAQGLRTYFHNCSRDIATNKERSSVSSLLKFAAVDYDFSDNPHIQFLKGVDGEGRKIKGYLAMKNDRKARPFVIVKCGVFCNADESSSIINAMMHLYDESPFHVLILANVTGSQFERENKAFAVGGFDEGRQLFQLAKFLKQEASFRDRISSVHVMGVSLGGHGALYSSLYSSVNSGSSGRVIDSVIAACPVVNLQNSLKNLYRRDLLSRGYTLYTFQVLKSIAEGLPFLGTALKNINRKRPEQMYELLTKLLLTYYSGWTQKKPWDLPPFEGVQVQSLQQFWDLNNFTLYSAQVQTPTLVIAADNDPVVRPSQNAGLIPITNPWVQVLQLEQGSHCAFSYANGYERWSRLLREYFLSHDPVWSKARRSADIELSLPYRPPRFTYQLQAEWLVLPQKQEALLTLKTLNYHPSGEVSCLGGAESDIDEVPNAESCISHYQFKISMQKILPVLNEAMPQNKFDARRLTRILNTRSTLRDRQGENYLRSQAPVPTTLRVDVYE